MSPVAEGVIVPQGYITAFNIEPSELDIVSLPTPPEIIVE
jgi:hypothetical protein